MEIAGAPTESSVLLPSLYGTLGVPPVGSGACCPICLEEMCGDEEAAAEEVERQACGHQFHHQCLKQYSAAEAANGAASVPCPVCRAALPFVAGAGPEDVPMNPQALRRLERAWLEQDEGEIAYRWRHRVGSSAEAIWVEFVINLFGAGCIVLILYYMYATMAQGEMANANSWYYGNLNNASSEVMGG